MVSAHQILTTASELKYTHEIKRILTEQMQEPTEDFVKFFATQVYTGKMTQKEREQFAELTRQALKSLINDQINSAGPNKSPSSSGWKNDTLLRSHNAN